MYLDYSLKTAGENCSQLREVLYHYTNVDKDPQKLEAAKYLIMNMPAHYSYRDTALVKQFYNTALEILGTGPSPDWQRDTLRQISDRDYAHLSKDIVSDVEIITCDYLINNIDRAFEVWRNRPWARHLTFDEFRDWVLPYKVTELQSFDDWREILAAYYSDSISTVPSDDEQRNSIYGAIEIVRNEIHNKQSAIGHRVIWEGRSGLPLLNAATWVRMTYGSCMDYVTMGTAVYRSLGLPAAVDYVPAWGRNSEGHSWYVFLSDKGREEPTINSLIMPAGMQFYPYERIPKVWRKTYTMNRDVVEYRNKAKYVYPFEVCQMDVTDHYNRTSDIQVEMRPDVKLKDKYVYIAMFVNSGGPQWNVLDYGLIKHGKACFKNMGRNILYIALGYDGKGLVPISHPFMLRKNGIVDYVNNEANEIVSMDLRRKYYESYNVVKMRRRMLGGQFQCAVSSDFSDAVTLYTIDKTDIPYRIGLSARTPSRYWRYLSPDGSWGSISELAFFDKDGHKIQGRHIANPEAGQDAIDRAFDGNLLSNFEINQRNGNWVGIDTGCPIESVWASVSPRSDDNDVCPGNEYELLFFNGHDWESLGYRRANDNHLHYDNIPVHTLLWLRNYTRGNDERPFVIDENKAIEWF